MQGAMMEYEGHFELGFGQPLVKILLVNFVSIFGIASMKSSLFSFSLNCPRFVENIHLPSSVMEFTQLMGPKLRLEWNSELYLHIYSGIE